MTSKTNLEAFRRYLTAISVRIMRRVNGEMLWALVGRLNAPGVQERMILVTKTRAEARTATREWREWRRKQR